MLPFDVALVLGTSQIPVSEFLRVAAALQRQVTRDFGPIWNVQATVDAFVSLEDVPIGYYPIIVLDNIGQVGVTGIHIDKGGQPLALVQYTNVWTLAASHECLEMLADPFGNRLLPGRSIQDNEGRVEYVVEVCDPCEALDFAYQVNGVVVSDFYTPSYFDPAPAAGVRYSFSGALTAPRQVLKGGYLTWHDPTTDHWWRKVYFKDEPEFVDLGVVPITSGSIRATLDPLTPYPELVFGVTADDPRLVSIYTGQRGAVQSAASRAGAWKEQIERLKTQAAA